MLGCSFGTLGHTKNPMKSSTSGLMKRMHHLSKRELGQWFLGCVIAPSLPTMTNVMIPQFRPAHHPKIRLFTTLSLLRSWAILLSPSTGGLATCLATTLISLTLRLKSQYTLHLILQLITGSRDVGSSYSHSMRACVDVAKVEMLKTPHRDGLL